MFLGYRDSYRSHTRLFRRKDGYYFAKSNRNLGIFAAIIYFNNCGQRFFTDILDDIGNIDVIFMDITDINGQGRIFKDT